MARRLGRIRSRAGVPRVHVGVLRPRDAGVRRGPAGLGGGDRGAGRDSGRLPHARVRRPLPARHAGARAQHRLVGPLHGRVHAVSPVRDAARGAGRRRRRRADRRRSPAHAAPHRRIPRVAVPMKTLHFTNAYHATSGGIRTFYEALLRDAEPHGRHVRLVVPGPRDHVEDVSAYARIYTIAAPPSPFVDRRYRLILPHRFLVPDRGPVWKILRDEQPDLVEICDKYAFCYLAGVLRTRAGRRPVRAGLTCERMDDGLRAFTRGGRIGEWFARWYLKRVYVPQLDVHIANSHYTASELPFNARHPRPVYVRPMGVDTDLFTPARRSHYRRAALRARLGVPHRAPLRLYAGRLSSGKTVDLLPALGEHLASGRAHLIVAGDGPRRTALERSTLNGRDRLHLFGHLADRGALADLMTDADLFVPPNPREP